MKNLPYDKTVVVEYKVQLADLLSRSVKLKGSVAAPIFKQNDFNSGDFTLTPEKPLLIANIESCIILQSFEDFEIVISGEIESIVMPCRGLFIHNGKAKSIMARAPAGVMSVRLQGVWS